jgi:hypothetical protein
LRLSLGKAKACLRLLVDSFKLEKTCRAGGPLSVGLRFVELVTVAGVFGLRSQIVQVIGVHAIDVLSESRRDCSVVAVTRQRPASRRALSVSGGV